MSDLFFTVENGKRIWRLKKDGGERRIDAPCETMRRAKEKALRVTQELSRGAGRKEKENTGTISQDSD